MRVHNSPPQASLSGVVSTRTTSTVPTRICGNQPPLPTTDQSPRPVQPTHPKELVMSSTLSRASSGTPAAPSLNQHNKTQLLSESAPYEAARLRSEVRDALTRMQGDLSHQWTMADLSAQVHLSPSRLRSLFVSQLGATPIAWLTRLRVQEMARLLLESHETVRAIAHRVGWANQAHAAQQFRKLVGRSPSAYRAEARRQGAAVCPGCGQVIEAP
ncbi:MULTISPECIES: helix-turn-helix transcriptional regulator [Actinomycetes]|uniref:helix-turn-helix transcriptional regulator n=2 Tax=Actinomycetes TaxID=1760 RepID=UPI000B328011|nr:AraC family transcriptional regulator [Helcobacillus massiliensis]